jgi:hypothetical protein
VDLEIVDVIFEVGRRGQAFSPEALEERMDGEDVRIRFRELLVSNAMYTDEEVAQAVKEIQMKTQKRMISESLKTVAGDPEAVNRLLKLKAQIPHPGQVVP